MMGKRRSSTVATDPAARPMVVRHHIADVPTVAAQEKVPTMIHPSDPDLGRPVAVRDGQGAPVTCAACGCRLSQTGDAWFHFSPIGGRDARGCRVGCADAAHDASGRPVSLAV